jgi:hypothetical protein
MLFGAIREQSESLGELMSQQAESARDLMHDQVETAEQAERDQTRQAHEKARERYEDLTKAELSDLLGRRDLPKAGTNDELIERLVEADNE